MDISKIRAELITRGFTQVQIQERMFPLEAIALERAKMAERHRLTKLSEQVIDETIAFIDEVLGIKPNRDQILKIIPPGSETYGVLCEYRSLSDTATRDEVADCMGMHLMGRSLPCYEDNWSEEQCQQFYSDLTKAAHVAGICVSTTNSTKQN